MMAQSDIRVQKRAVHHANSRSLRMDGYPMILW